MGPQQSAQCAAPGFGLNPKPPALFAASTGPTNWQRRIGEPVLHASCGLRSAFRPWVHRVLPFAQAGEGRSPQGCRILVAEWWLRS